MESITYRPAALSAAASSTEHSVGLRRSENMLATGQRTADLSANPASTSVASMIKSDIAVLGQLVDNINSALNILGLMQSTLRDVTKLVADLRGAAMNASLPTYSEKQREALDGTYQAALTHITTTHNDTKLFGQAVFGRDWTFQVGLGTDSTLTIPGTEILVNANALGLTGNLQSDTAASTEYGAVSEALETLARHQGTLAAIQSRFNAVLDAAHSQLSAEISTLDTVDGVDFQKMLQNSVKDKALLSIAQATLSEALQKVASDASFVTTVIQTTTQKLG